MPKRYVLAASICVLVTAAASAGCHKKPVTFLSDVKTGDISSAKQLLDGFYTIEEGQWRWAARQFAIVLKPPANAMTSGATLQVKMYLPALQIEKLGPMTLTADVGDLELKPEIFAEAGSITYTRYIPASAFSRQLLPIVFAFDKALSPLGADGRELAAVVSEISLEPKSKL